ncbi:MAG TPA: pyridoxamine 5'-phosphate oxidase family protein [Acidimicrobiia bacterium]|nr:pyridoxamine 5'-phosphate oxidase family protein [Acidimicrobiia bacterium]
MEPHASRPHMPDYGIAAADVGTGLLPWSWATERLAASHDYWLATVWPDGRPHVTPVWGVWWSDAVWFSAGGRARKTRNLERNPQAVITTDNALEPVIVEGAVARVDDADSIAAFADAVNRKYETSYSVEFFTENVCFQLRPRRAFGLTEADFVGSPTRWTFDGGPVGPGR